MRNFLRRWFGASDDDGQVAVARWADAAGHRFGRNRDGNGFFVEPARGQAGWRLEWGPPQRHYIDGNELRLRADIGAGSGLRMLVATRPLMTLLEQQVYEEFTEGKQTRMDDDTPEEMRWLVLYPKVPRAELGALRERFGALSNLPRAAVLWLDGPLGKQLEASASWLPEDLAMVLLVQRGRLTLRCQQPQISLSVLQAALGLFGVARAAARRVANEVNQGAVGSERPSTWGAPSAMPGAEAPGTPDDAAG
jgi:hypothetical protein